LGTAKIEKVALPGQPTTLASAGTVSVEAAATRQRVSQRFAGLNVDWSSWRILLESSARLRGLSLV
jgi:hypothetical protein